MWTLILALTFALIVFGSIIIVGIKQKGIAKIVLIFLIMMLVAIIPFVLITQRTEIEELKNNQKFFKQQYEPITYTVYKKK